MLKTDTLKKNYEFKNVLTKGKYYNGNYIDIYIKKNNKKINYIDRKSTRLNSSHMPKYRMPSSA